LSSILVSQGESNTPSRTTRLSIKVGKKKERTLQSHSKCCWQCSEYRPKALRSRQRITLALVFQICFSISSTIPYRWKVERINPEEIYLAHSRSALDIYWTSLSLNGKIYLALEQIYIEFTSTSYLVIVFIREFTNRWRSTVIQRRFRAKAVGSWT